MRYIRTNRNLLSDWDCSDLTRPLNHWRRPFSDPTRENDRIGDAKEILDKGSIYNIW